MKRLMLIALCLMMTLCLTACGQPKAASTADKPLQELVDSVTGEMTGLVSMPKTDLEDVIGIDPADFTEAVYRQDDQMGGQEIVVLRANDKDAAQRIAALLESYLDQRRKETRNYLPEAYKLLEKAKVETKNNTVALISAEKAAEITTRLLAGE
jgi:hypothetical protein